jgi:hypothetical protein
VSVYDLDEIAMRLADGLTVLPGTSTTNDIRRSHLRYPRARQTSST